MGNYANGWPKNELQVPRGGVSTGSNLKDGPAHKAVRGFPPSENRAKRPDKISTFGQNDAVVLTS